MITDEELFEKHHTEVYEAEYVSLCDESIKAITEDKLKILLKERDKERFCINCVSNKYCALQKMVFAKSILDAESFGCVYFNNWKILDNENIS